MKKTTRRSKQSSPVVAAASDANEKKHYEERIRELERENKVYQTKIAELKERKGNNSSASNDGVEKLKKDYLQKLNLLEDQVSKLKKKLGSQSQFSTYRKRDDESTRKLQYEIQNLKAHKDAEHELEVTTQFRKLCSQYESKIEKMTGEIAQLKEEIEMQRQENSS